MSDPYFQKKVVQFLKWRNAPGSKARGINAMQNRQINRLQKRMRGMKQEIKRHDVATAGGLDIDNVGGFVPLLLTQMAQGLTSLTRLGLKVRAKKLLINYNIVSVGAGGDAQTVWIFVVLDVKCNGSASTYTGTLASDVIEADVSQQFNVHFAHETFGQRYKILAQRKFVMQQTAGSDHLARNGTINIKLDKNIEYIGTAAGIANAGKNSIHLMAISSVPAGANTPHLSINSRLLFTDS